MRTESLGVADSCSSNDIVVGEGSTWCMQYSEYAVLSVYSTWCICYFVYTVLGVCSTQCMEYLVYTVLGIYTTRCMQYSLYAAFGIWGTGCGVMIMEWKDSDRLPNFVSLDDRSVVLEMGLGNQPAVLI